MKILFIKGSKDRQLKINIFYMWITEALLQNLVSCLLSKHFRHNIRHQMVGNNIIPLFDSWDANYVGRRLQGSSLYQSFNFPTSLFVITSRHICKWQWTEIWQPL